MPPAPSTPTICGTLTWREVNLAGLILLVLMSAQVVLSGALYLFGRDLTPDEVCTKLIVTDAQGLRHALRAMAHGADANLPTYHGALYLLGRVTGAMTDKTMRLVAFGSMALALLGIYATLRCVFPRLPAAAGTLAVWSNWEVIEYAFEARMYAPLLAAGAWFAFALSLAFGEGEAWADDGPVRAVPPNAPTPLCRLPTWNRTCQALLLSVTAVLLCTLHYLGIIAWVLMVVAALCTSAGPVLRRCGRLWPALAGPAALACFVPFYLVQRASLPSGPWQPPPSLYALWDFTSRLTPLYALLAAAIGYFLSRRDRARHAAGPDPAPGGAERWRRVRPVLPLAALILFLPALIAFSFTVQPVIDSRHFGILFVAGWAPVVAYLAWRALPSQATMLCLILIVLAYFGVAKARWQLREDRALDGRIKLFHDAGVGADIVVCTRHDTLLAVVDKDPTLADRCFGRNFGAVAFGGGAGGATGGGGASPGAEFAVAQGRAIESYYGRPRLIRTERLQHLDHFFLFGPREDIEKTMRFLPGYTMDIKLADDKAAFLKGQLVRCFRSPAPAPATVPTTEPSR